MKYCKLLTITVDRGDDENPRDDVPCWDVFDNMDDAVAALEDEFYKNRGLTHDDIVPVTADDERKIALLDMLDITHNRSEWLEGVGRRHCLSGNPKLRYELEAEM